jgi:hypothetical protein
MNLTPTQQRDVERARQLYDAQGPHDLTAILKERGHLVPHPSDPYPEAFGMAAVAIGDLLEIIDSLTGGAS